MKAGTLAVLFDTDCGLCVATAGWLGRRVAPDALRIVPLTAAVTEPRLAAATTGRDLTATLHVVRDDGRVLTGARAVLAAGRLVPRWRWLAIAADHRLGLALLEPVYRFVAAHRRGIGRLLRLPAECRVPAPPHG